MVGRWPTRTEKLQLALELERGAAGPMGKRAGLVVPSLATERELAELVPSSLGVLALSAKCSALVVVTLIRLWVAQTSRRCCGASLMVALTLWGVGGLLLSVVVVLVVGGGRASCLKGFVARGQGGHLGRPRVGAGVRLARWLLAGEKFPWA